MDTFYESFQNKDIDDWLKSTILLNLTEEEVSKKPHQVIEQLKKCDAFILGLLNSEHNDYNKTIYGLLAKAEFLRREEEAAINANTTSKWAIIISSTILLLTFLRYVIT